MYDTQHRVKKNPIQVISVTGGKGGIGKTSTSINIALGLANLNKKVLLFDADLGLSNVDVLLGLQPKKTIADVLKFLTNPINRDVVALGDFGL